MRSLGAISLTLAVTVPALADHPVFLLDVPAPIGVARLVMPAGASTPPLVIVLPDALGEDGRSEPYVGSLLARGIAVLSLGLGEDLDATPSPVEPAASPAAVGPAADWARGAGFGPLGLLGFGLGGRAVLEAAEGLPAIALYPGCVGSFASAGGAALILEAATEAAACEGVTLPPGREMRLLAGAGPGWDVPGSVWPAGLLLADPVHGGLRRVSPDLNVTLRAAEATADWFEERLFGGARAASR